MLRSASLSGERAWAWPLVFAALLSACAPAKPPAPPAIPAPTPAQRLTSADALVRAGCLDCLIEAYGEYELLRAIPSARDAGTAGAIRTAALIALRQRELGMVEDGYLQRARGLMVGAAGLPAWLPGILDIIDVLTTAGTIRTPTNDIDLERGRAMRTNHDAWDARLRDVAPIDELGAYVWLAFACSENRTLTLDELAAPVATFRDAPLIVFRRATCRGVEPEPLLALFTGNPRFVETKFFLGRYDVGLLVSGHNKLDEADTLYADAYAWHDAWPSLTQAIANLAMTLEEFDRAGVFYDHTLEHEPHAVDALLGKAKALTYQTKHLDAIATLDQLMAERWFVGDARYWRAANLTELDRYDEAWTDIELAAKLIVNAEVPKLAGVIAYRRHELDVSRAKFEQSLGRNPRDCETSFYLGVVLAEQRVWPRTAQVLVGTAACLDVAAHGYLDEIAEIRASHDPPERQARKIARREGYIARGRRQMATAWFDTAVAYYNLSKNAEARQYADKVADDEQFGERARELLARLNK